MNEGAVEYREVPGFPGYRVGDDGSVWSNKQGGHWKPLKPDVDARGRRRFALCRDSQIHRLRASRLVLLAFVGPCPDGLECCHDNGDEGDDRLTNLRWDTHSANLLDRRRHGTSVCGEAVHTAKLTADDVREIRRLRGEGWGLKRLSERYDVTGANVSAICNRRTWQHV